MSAHHPYDHETIFVQMASYRDPQLLPTLRDLFEKATSPDLLHVCICWQHNKEDEWDKLEEFADHPNVTILDIDSKDSKGACWARNMIQQEYKGEDFTFQLDSHHRFIEGWDDELKSMYYQLELQGKNPLITGYIPGYSERTGKPIQNEPWRLAFNYFGHDGPLHTVPEDIPNWKGLNGPVNARFFSAHFAFTDGKFSTKVQHDPEMYFHGEEITLAVRAYTHGYDLVHPHKVIAWHHYGRKGNPKHWDDGHDDWHDTNAESFSRTRKLLGINNERFKKGFKYKYGLGTVRSLKEYEAYAGVRFKDRSVQQFTLDKHHPPNPSFKTKKAYNASFLNIFKHCIDLAFDAVPQEEFACWAVAYKDKDGNELYRYDIQPEHIKNLTNPKKEDYIKIWTEFSTTSQPTSWVVWPNTKEGGWTDAPLVGNI